MRSRWWSAAAGGIHGFALIRAVDGWAWQVAAVFFLVVALAHAIVVVAYGEACAREAREADRQRRIVRGLS